MKKIYLSLLTITLFIPFVGCSSKPEVVDISKAEYNKQFFADLQKDKEIKAQERAEPMIRAFRPLNLHNSDFMGIAYVLNGSSSSMNNVNSLTQLAHCIVYDKSMPKYVVVTNEDMLYWTVLQKVSKGTLVQISNKGLSTVFLIEGSIQETLKQHLRRNYLLIPSGTYTYNTPIGNREVTKLKILSDLTGY